MNDFITISKRGLSVSSGVLHYKDVIIYEWLYHHLSVSVSSGVYLCGHSAGGHLVAMLLAVDWLTECMVSPSLIKGQLVFFNIIDNLNRNYTYIIILSNILYGFLWYCSFPCFDLFIKILITSRCINHQNIPYFYANKSIDIPKMTA